MLLELAMKEQFRALHPADVLAFFQGLGLSEEVNAGRVRCTNCGDAISAENFRAATRHQGRLLFVCNKPGCLVALTEISNRRAA